MRKLKPKNVILGMVLIIPRITVSIFSPFTFIVISLLLYNGGLNRVLV